MLEALVDYEIEVDDPTREVPNRGAARLSGSRDRHEGETDRNSQGKNHRSHNDRNGDVSFPNLLPLIDGSQPVKHPQQNPQAKGQRYSTNHSPSDCNEVIGQHTRHPFFPHAEQHVSDLAVPSSAA